MNQPKEIKPLESLNNEPLLPDLVNFTARAAEMQNSYLVEFSTNPGKKASFERAEGKIIFTTESEREKFEGIANLTKAQLKERIFQIIQQLPEDQSKFMEDRFKKTINGKNKQEYIDFYSELNEME